LPNLIEEKRLLGN